jgi:hypothetical protein
VTRSASTVRREVLSGWQTVAISIAASAITGLTALLVALVRGRQERGQLGERLAHEREQQLVERQLLVTADFSAAIDQTHRKCRICLDTRTRLAREDPWPAQVLEESRQLVEELRPQLSVISLLFGPGSPAAEAGTEAFDATCDAQSRAAAHFYAIEDVRVGRIAAGEDPDLTFEQREEAVEPAKYYMTGAEARAEAALKTAIERFSEFQQVAHDALATRAGRAVGRSEPGRAQLKVEEPRPRR